mmetsp:Transcript_6043/g.18125  ORF Transcript_6043/g.18125 Transcript_6043/m.18125 type:complete len:96 (+) Transcript_6043:2638-2925(+)
MVFIRFQESPKPVFYFTSSSVLSYPLTQWHVHSLEINASHWTSSCFCEFITANVATTGCASVIVFVPEIIQLISNTSLIIVKSCIYFRLCSKINI